MSDRRPSVCIIGPVSPYRGGISQYTESLAEAFAEIADVRVISFSKQYPARLYPGERDTSPDGQWQDDVEYLLSATDPRTWRRTVRSIAAGRPDLVLINWWTLYWQPWTALMTRGLRARGIRVVLLCHNIGDHGARGVRKRLGAAMLSQADGYVVHSSQLETELRALVPGKPVLCTPMPAFDRFPEAVGALEPRAGLEVLFFGFIRPYKGLDVLIEAYRRLDRGDVMLSVVGESWAPTDELARAADELGFELRTEYVSDAEAAEYFARADVIVLPYLTAAGSAVVAAAFHHGKPVVASRVGGIPDVVDASTGWLVDPGDADALRDALAGLSREQAQGMADAVRSAARELTWTAMARRVADTFLGTSTTRSGTER